MIIGWHLTFLRQGQICFPIHLYLENVEKSFSQNVLDNNVWNLQCMIKVVNHFSYNQTFVPAGLSAFTLELYNVKIFKRRLLWNRSANFHQIFMYW